ncbi:Chondroadherin-like Protein [Tribolium castaneum]|uniref:Chondroadherin-like Protein n=1 Tax=Tribolium castaneum TaxID=7070 RepID=D2A4Z3_TRICA|nr:Chondroadherin-like Protein [Tribolium castaneum]
MSSVWKTIVLLLHGQLIATLNYCDHSVAIEYQTLGFRPNYTKESRFGRIISLEKNVKVINIFNQNIPILCKSLFNVTKTAQALYIVKSKIREIEENIFKDQNITNIVVITGNKIATIKTLTFGNLQITSLDLRENQIEVIEEKAFVKLFNLGDLRLTGNKLKRFNPLSYHQLPSLEILSLDGNKIEALEPESLRFVQKDNFFMDLKRNRIFRLEGDFFGGFKRENLSLYLSRNFLEVLPDGVFNNHSFYNVFLQKNPLRNVTGKICTESCTITHLYLDKECLQSCDKQFFDWIQTKGIILNHFSNNVKVFRNCCRCKRINLFLIIVIIIISMNFGRKKHVCNFCYVSK